MADMREISQMVDYDKEAKAQDYCYNIEDTVSNKLHMISVISAYDTPEDEGFMAFCTDYVSTFMLNPWYDPFIPNDSITVDDMCIALQQLYVDLRV